jgi:hypothetical protein
MTRPLYPDVDEQCGFQIERVINLGKETNGCLTGNKPLNPRVSVVEDIGDEHEPRCRS